MGERHLATDSRPAIRIALAWGVHALTALGAGMGLLALAAIGEGRYVLAFAWMGGTILIDSVDGTLARVANVKHYLPAIDGALLDNVTDFFTYVIVPAYFIHHAGVVPGVLGAATAFTVILASAYQFCQADAKTADYYFKGFPSYWNVVAFYLFFLDLDTWVNFAVVMALVGLVFVPIKYLYPSRTPAFRPLTLALSIVWGATLLAYLTLYPGVNQWLLYGSLAFIAYYFAMSSYLTWRGQQGA